MNLAAAAGDPDALYQRAIWRLIGEVLPRDIAAALHDFSAARRLKHVDATLIEVALVGNGSGTVPDFAAASRLLKSASEWAAPAAQQYQLLSKMKLRADGEPTLLPVHEALGSQNIVIRYPALLNPAECSHVANSAQDLLKPATVVDPRDGRLIAHPVRTSDGAVVGPLREDLVVRAINLRIAAITKTHVDQGEALALLRYRPGQQFRLHFDAIAGASNQRIATVLVYLNDNFEGGETSFPELGLTIKPQVGDAIVFRNVLADGSIDQRLRHAGLPVKRGVKWLATRWIRADPIDPWNVTG